MAKKLQNVTILSQFNNCQILVKCSWLAWRNCLPFVYIKFHSWTYGWESFCYRGPDRQHQEIANRNLGVMLNEFACEFWRSLKSLLAETKRRVRLATNISQVFEFLSLLRKMLKFGSCTNSLGRAFHCSMILTKNECNNEWGVGMWRKLGCKGRLEHANISGICNYLVGWILFSSGKRQWEVGEFWKTMCVATMLFDPFNPLEAWVTCSDIVRF